MPEYERGSGWHIKVVHDSGAVHTPTVLEQGTQWLPRLNDQPRVQIAVPKSPKWERGGFEGAEMTVWKDGRELPIDQIESISSERNHVILEGIGGVELEQNVDGLEYPEEATHVAAEDAVTSNTSYAFDADSPESDTREDVELFSASTTEEWQNRIADYPFDADDPRYINNGEVYCHQTAWFIEAEDSDNYGSSWTYHADTEGRDGEWSGNSAVRIYSGSDNTLTFPFETQYTVPAGEMWFYICYAMVGTPTAAIETEINIQVNSGGGTYQVSSNDAGSFTESTDMFDMNSIRLAPIDQEIPPGNHELTISTPDGGEMFIDFIHIYDSRYDYDQSDDNTTNEVVDGWQEYPQSLTYTLDPAQSVEQVTAASTEIGIDDTSGGQSIGLRNDQTASWDTASNTTTHSAEFDSATQIAQVQVTLSRYQYNPDRSSGYDFQRLDNLSLSADLVNVPVVLDFVHDGKLKKGLNRMADTGNFIWEVRRIDGTDTIVWTQPGTRVSDVDPGLVDYSAKRTTERSYQEAIIKGQSQSEEEEAFSADSYDTLVEFAEGPPIVPNSETIYDANGNEFERRLDYNIDHRGGGIRLLSGGNMSTGTTYYADYRWRYEDGYVDPEATNPDTIRETFPDASSDRECNQLALSIVREVGEPLEEVTAVVQGLAPDQPLTEAIHPDEVPFEGPFRVRKIETEPGIIKLTLGTREDVTDIQQQLNNRLSALARNT